MDLVAPALVTALLVVYGLTAGRLDRLHITGPMAFTVVGALLGPAFVGVLDVGLDTEGVRVLAEIALVLVLFGDASRLDSGRLRQQGGLPARLLLLGMPLTIGAGAVVAKVVFGGIDWELAALLGVVLAPTDAALGQAVVSDERIPVRVRQALNVESGLNDGLAAPMFALMLATVAGGGSASLPRLLLIQVGVGAVAGLVVGGTTAVGLRAATARDWANEDGERVVAVGAAVLAWALAGLLGGNGFIAAFTGGLVWAAVRGLDATVMTAFLEGDGKLVSLLVWLVFGAMFAGPTLDGIDWRIAVYAVASLTIVRMLPVALATANAGLRRETVGLLGWFGPRGLASIVFALEAVDTLGGAEGDVVRVAVSATVLLSVALHGVSAGPLASWYAARLADQAPHAPEQRSVPPMRTRGM